MQNNLNLVNKCVKINVFINSDDSFVNQPEVADGASNLITKIMSPNSDHARSAVSVNSLPKNATVEIDSFLRLHLKDRIQITAESSINKFKAKDWDNCNKNGNVFLSYNFLKH